MTDELKCLKFLCIKVQFKESKAFSKSKKSSSPGMFLVAAIY